MYIYMLYVDVVPSSLVLVVVVAVEVEVEVEVYTSNYLK